jgi:hypothetical protein
MVSNSLSGICLVSRAQPTINNLQLSSKLFFRKLIALRSVPQINAPVKQNVEKFLNNVQYNVLNEHL